MRRVYLEDHAYVICRLVLYKMTPTNGFPILTRYDPSNGWTDGVGIISQSSCSGCAFGEKHNAGSKAARRRKDLNQKLQMRGSLYWGPKASRI